MDIADVSEEDKMRDAYESLTKAVKRAVVVAGVLDDHYADEVKQLTKTINLAVLGLCGRMGEKELSLLEQSNF